MKYILVLKLNKVMKQKGITAKDLSERSGISKSEIYHICRNEKNATLYTMLVLAAEIGVELSDLYDFKENCPP